MFILFADCELVALLEDDTGMEVGLDDTHFFIATLTD